MGLKNVLIAHNKILTNLNLTAMPYTLKNRHYLFPLRINRPKEICKITFGLFYNYNWYKTEGVKSEG